jgi:hypothetical protein
MHISALEAKKINALKRELQHAAPFLIINPTVSMAWLLGCIIEHTEH